MADAVGVASCDEVNSFGGGGCDWRRSGRRNVCGCNINDDAGGLRCICSIGGLFTRSFSASNLFSAALCCFFFGDLTKLLAVLKYRLVNGLNNACCAFALCTYASHRSDAFVLGSGPRNRLLARFFRRPTTKTIHLLSHFATNCNECKAFFAIECCFLSIKYDFLRS